MTRDTMIPSIRPSPIDKYFEQMDDFVQFEEYGKTPYLLEQIILTAMAFIMGTGLYM